MGSNNGYIDSMMVSNSIMQLYETVEKSRTTVNFLALEMERKIQKLNLTQDISLVHVSSGYLSTAPKG